MILEIKRIGNGMGCLGSPVHGKCIIQMRIEMAKQAVLITKPESYPAIAKPSAEFILFQDGIFHTEPGYLIGKGAMVRNDTQITNDE